MTDDVGSTAPLPGDELAGRYRLKEQLIERDGACSFRSVDAVLRRDVMIDLVPDGDERAAEMLAAARVAATASDPRFLQILDATSTGGWSYCVREWIEGRDLATLLAGGPMTGQQAAHVMLELAEALAGIHAGPPSGRAHGLVDPAHVIITQNGSVKVAGLATAAVLAGVPAGERTPNADVTAAAKVMYAALVARWPGGPAFGLADAPHDGRGRPLSPRQVRAGVPHALDQICHQALSTPMTADDLVGRLRAAVGSRDVRPDRGHRVGAAPVDAPGAGPVPGGHARHRRSGAGVAGAAGAGAAAGAAAKVGEEATVAHLAGPGGAGGAPDGAGGASARGFGPGDPDAPEPTTYVPGGDDRGGETFTTPQPSVSRAGRSRAWGVRILVALGLVALAGIVTLALVFGRGALSGSDTADTPSPGQAGTTGATGTTTTDGQSPASASASGQPVKITDASDFDPRADGGNGEEYPNRVKRSFDGDPATYWQTMAYEPGELGRSKPGVGVVYDLGRQVPVASATLTVIGSTDFKVLVPTGDTAQKPNAIRGWSEVASRTGADKQVTLTFKPATTRYVLVYLTKLPADGNRFRGKIAELSFKN